MSRTYLAILFSIFFIKNSSAQLVELGIGAGVGNYFGDLASYPVVTESKPTGSLFVRLNLSSTWAWTNQFSYIQISGDDRNYAVNAPRGLSFTTNISEFSSLMEFNYLKFGPGVLDEKSTGFVYAGLAAAMFTPKAKIGDTWYELRDYQTEGVVYSKQLIAIPFGIGFKAIFHRNMTLEWQLGFRKTFTDYLDDVSTVYPDMDKVVADKGLISLYLTDRTAEGNGGIPLNKSGYKRGNPDNRDWYMTSTISFVYRLNSRVKCARFF